jgi:hypothetical protein
MNPITRQKRIADQIISSRNLDEWFSPIDLNQDGLISPNEFDSSLI